MKSILKKAAGIAFIATLALGMFSCANDSNDDPVFPPAPTKETVATPVFSVASGEVESGTEVTITCTTEGAKVYYTTDGSEPTASSTEYTAAISIEADVTIKAIAVKDGMNDSAVASASYTLKDNEMPAVDNTTLDGWYVQTSMVCGKPCNKDVIYIKGTKLYWWYCYPERSETIEQLDNIKVKYDAGPGAYNNGAPITIKESGLEFVLSVFGGTHTYTLQDKNDGTTWLLKDGEYVDAFQKVYSPNWTSSVIRDTSDVYFNGDNVLSLTTYPDNTENGFFELTFNDDFYSSESMKETTPGYFEVNGIYGIHADEIWNITVTDTSATISYTVSETGLAQDVCKTYTRYVRNKPWPVVDTNDSHITD